MTYDLKRALNPTKAALALLNYNMYFRGYVRGKPNFFRKGKMSRGSKSGGSKRKFGRKSMASNKSKSSGPQYSSIVSEGNNRKNPKSTSSARGIAIFLLVHVPKLSFL